MENIPNCYDVEHAVSLAILKALQFAKDFDITHFHLESDALCIIKKINSHQIDLSVIGNIIEDIRSLKNEFPAIKIDYGSRKTNMVAHAASRLALNVRGESLWFTNFPRVVMHAAISDLS